MPSNMLSFDDRKFLLAVERGDVASTRRYVKKLIWKRIYILDLTRRSILGSDGLTKYAMRAYRPKTGLRLPK